MATTQYIGARYVPIFGRLGEDSIQWDNAATYEPLTVVLHQGNSYTSRQFVPVGIEITNGDYWAETGNYNAQIEQYRQQVQGFGDDIEANTAAITAETERAKAAEEANAAAIAAETERAEAAEKANADAIAAETERAEAAEKANADSITRNSDAIAAETARAESVENELKASIKNAGWNPPSCVSSALPVFRYEYNMTENAQGGCYVNNSYAIAFASASYFKVVLYALDGTILSSKMINIANYHANGMDYRNGKLIVAGSTTNGSNIYIFTINGTSIGDYQIIQSSSFNVDYVWGFGFYKENKYWYSEGLGVIYSIDESFSNVEELCTNPYNISDYGLQQNIWYDQIHDCFISVRTSSFTFFSPEGNLLGTCPLAKSYNSVFCEEIEDVSFNAGWFWFHNNDLFFNDFNAKKVGCVFKTFEDGSAPKIAIFEQSSDVKITIGASEPTIFKQTNSIDGGFLRYPKDLAALAIENPDTTWNISISSDIADFMLVFNSAGFANINDKKIRGIVSIAPSTISIYGAGVALQSTDYWGSDVFWQAFGGNVSIITSLPNISGSTSKKFTNSYGGIVIVKSGSENNANLSTGNAAVITIG